MASSPDGHCFLTCGVDQTLQIHVPERRLPLLTLFFADDQWIAWTPEGYYAASPGGERLMGWQVNNGLEQMATFYPAAQFRKSLYRPDVIKLLLQAGSLEKALEIADRARGKASQRVEVGDVLPPQVRITSLRSLAAGRQRGDGGDQLPGPCGGPRAHHRRAALRRRPPLPRQRVLQDL